jgi:hypothetical protein
MHGPGSASMMYQIQSDDMAQHIQNHRITKQMANQRQSNQNRQI